MATLSIMALYEYDNTVLEGFLANLPTPEKVPIDKYPDSYIQPLDLNSAALIDNIMIECAELEFMYPTMALAKRAITAWSVGMADKWQKLYNTMWMLYNPLWNNWRKFTSERNRQEQGENLETRNLTEGRDITRTVNNTQTNNLTESTEYDSSNTRTDNLNQNTTSETSVSAYNSSDYEPREKTVLSQTNTGTVTNADNGSGSITDSGTIKNDGSENTEETSTSGGTVKNENSGTGNETYTEQSEGSIGVITSEIMLQQEREAALFNIYDIITTDFKNRFCLLIY